MSGDIFGCHNWVAGRRASNGQRRGLLPKTLQHTEQWRITHPTVFPNVPKYQTCWVWETSLQRYVSASLRSAFQFSEVTVYQMSCHLEHGSSRVHLLTSKSPFLDYGLPRSVPCTFGFHCAWHGKEQISLSTNYIQATATSQFLSFFFFFTSQFLNIIFFLSVFPKSDRGQRISCVALLLRVSLDPNSSVWCYCPLKHVATEVTMERKERPSSKMF